MALFKDDLGLQGTILFLDLDIVIFRNIDRFFKYKPGKFCIIHDIFRQSKSKKRYLLAKIFGDHGVHNSAVFRFESGQHSEIWEKYIKDRDNIEKRLKGDQDWITECLQSRAKLWPPRWCMSYKWEIAGRLEMDNKTSYHVPRSDRFLPKNCMMGLFHGVPDPHEVLDDPIMRDNWV